jgi:hypothetical protein
VVKKHSSDPEVYKYIQSMSTKHDSEAEIGFSRGRKTWPVFAMDGDANIPRRDDLEARNATRGRGGEESPSVPPQSYAASLICAHIKTVMCT